MEAHTWARERSPKGMSTLGTPGCQYAGSFFRFRNRIRCPRSVIGRRLSVGEIPMVSRRAQNAAQSVLRSKGSDMTRLLCACGSGGYGADSVGHLAILRAWAARSAAPTFSGVLSIRILLYG